MTQDNLKLGIIVGTTRKGRVTPQVAEWVLKQAQERTHDYELLDIKDYELPLLGETDAKENVKQWQDALAKLDGFVFVTAEYNHSLPAALKNAIDSPAPDKAWYNKAAAIVSHGSAGGTRATEHLRGVLNEIMIADVRAHVFFSMFDDFDDGTFSPREPHKKSLKTLFSQLEAWAGALKPLRK